MGRLNKLGCLGHRPMITFSNIYSDTILKVVKNYLRTLLDSFLANVLRTNSFWHTTFTCHEECKEILSHSTVLYSTLLYSMHSVRKSKNKTWEILGHEKAGSVLLN